MAYHPTENGATRHAACFLNKSKAERPLLLKEDDEAINAKMKPQASIRGGQGRPNEARETCYDLLQKKFRLLGENNPRNHQAMDSPFTSLPSRESREMPSRRFRKDVFAIMMLSNGHLWPATLYFS